MRRASSRHAEGMVRIELVAWFRRGKGQTYARIKEPEGQRHPQSVWPGFGQFDHT
jgi:hypothetical protein